MCWAFKNNQHLKFKEVMQPSPQAFSARSFLDSTMSCDVTDRYAPRIAENAVLSPALSQTSRRQRIKREHRGTRLVSG